MAYDEKLNASSGMYISSSGTLWLLTYCSPLVVWFWVEDSADIVLPLLLFFESTALLKCFLWPLLFLGVKPILNATLSEH